MSEAETANLYCVSHKPVVTSSESVCVLQVGNATDTFATYRDNTGDNIAPLNANFSELTGHYWVWKNRPATTVGFCHYRRFLIPGIATDWLTVNASQPYKGRPPFGIGNYASGYFADKHTLNTRLTQLDYGRELRNELENHDILLPKHNPVMEGGLIRQYGRAHPIEPFYAMLAAIAQIDNDMGKQALTFFTEHEYAHWNNLYYTHWDVFDAYCKFQFDVLLSLVSNERSFNDLYQNRYCAFLSERLLNFWVWHSKLKVKQLDWCMTEDLEQATDSHQRVVGRKAANS